MALADQDYAFWPTASLTYSIAPQIAGYTSAINEAIAAWTNVSPFSLTYIGTSGGDIHVRDKIDPNSQYVGRATTSLDGFGNVTGVTVELGNGTTALAVHEIGHALSHVRDYDPDIPDFHSVFNMNFWDYPSYYTVYGTFSTAPLGPEIEAIQERYGASSADNLIYAGEGGYTVSGGWGNDTIHGEGGNDIIYGNQGLDVLYGGEGDDTIYGGQNSGSPSGSPLALRDGVETVQGGNGSDVIYGNHGNDELYGEAGNDTLYGGQNDDILVGGDGTDRLIGNLGNDSYWGNSGADIFEVIGGGSDVVWDFNAAEGDRIDVANPGTVSLQSNGADAIFWHETGSITLVGISQSQASLDWLI